MVTEWEEAPAHMLRLDTRSLLQDAVITEVKAMISTLWYIYMSALYIPY